MMRKELRTPYKPMLDSSDDTKHFDNDICNTPIESPTQSLNALTPPLKVSNEVEDDFDGFTFEAQTI